MSKETNTEKMKEGEKKNEMIERMVICSSLFYFVFN